MKLTPLFHFLSNLPTPVWAVIFKSYLYLFISLLVKRSLTSSISYSPDYMVSLCLYIDFFNSQAWFLPSFHILVLFFISILRNTNNFEEHCITLYGFSNALLVSIFLKLPKEHSLLTFKKSFLLKSHHLILA